MWPSGRVLAHESQDQVATHFRSSHCVLVNLPHLVFQLTSFRNSNFKKFGYCFFIEISKKLSRRLLGSLFPNTGGAAPKPPFITFIESTCSVRCGESSFEEAS